jgi:TrmH family RNA methyltransferase
VQTITSPQNGHIKEVIKLSKRSVRDQRRLTVVEGLREASRALDNHVIPQEVYFCPDLVKGADASAWRSRLHLLEEQHQTQLYEVTAEVFAKIAYREESDGLLLVIPYLERQLAQVPLRTHPLLCVIEGVEKPGNLGAILRTADAAGVDGVIVCAGATDLHNPNVVRASLGTLFTVAVVEATSAAAISWLRQHGITIVATTPEATQRFTAVDLSGPVAIVMGNEASGLGAEWLAAADLQVSIPMHGVADSLNLATATALLLYEAVRQRHPQPAKVNPA